MSDPKKKKIFLHILYDKNCKEPHIKLFSTNCLKQSKILLSILSNSNDILLVRSEEKFILSSFLVWMLQFKKIENIFFGL